MNSLVLSVFAAQYLTEHHFFPPWLADGSVSLWVIWIGLARLYMGLHTPIDIFGGFAAGLFLLWIWICFVGAIFLLTVGLCSCNLGRGIG
jgi:membrane-associated phospholipid phosphatase